MIGTETGDKGRGKQGEAEAMSEAGRGSEREGGRGKAEAAAAIQELVVRDVTAPGRTISVQQNPDDLCQIRLRHNGGLNPLPFRNFDAIAEWPKATDMVS